MKVDNDVIHYDVTIWNKSIVNLVKQTLHQRLIQKKLQNQKKMNLMNFWTWDRKNKVIWHRQCLSNDQIRKFMISRNRLIIYTKEKPHLEKILDHQQRKVWNTNPFKHSIHPNLTSQYIHLCPNFTLSKFWFHLELILTVAEFSPLQ